MQKRHLVKLRDGVFSITTASALHDIGKVAIDDRILNAHDLTPEQTAILHTHPILGAQMLENPVSYTHLRGSARPDKYRTDVRQRQRSSTCLRRSPERSCRAHG